MILLPAIDLRDGKCVRLVQGDFAKETVYDDDPIAVAMRNKRDGAEWLHVVDLDAALLGEPRNRSIIEKIIFETAIPVQVSGGLRTVADIEWAFKAGAARVVLGTKALKEKGFVAAALGTYGERIAVGLDVRGDRLQARGWTEDAGELYKTLRALDKAGVGRYVVTDIEKDGMLSGPNLELLTSVMSKTDAHVVASGGVGTVEDLRALARIGVEGCIVGKALYANRFTLAQAIATSKRV